MPYLYQNSNHLAQKYKKSSSIDIFQMEKDMICKTTSPSLNLSREITSNHF